MNRLLTEINNPAAGHDIGMVILEEPVTDVTPIPYNTAALTRALVGKPARCS